MVPSGATAAAAALFNAAQSSAEKGCFAACPQAMERKRVQTDPNKILISL